MRVAIGVLAVLAGIAALAATTFTCAHPRGATEDPGDRGGVSGGVTNQVSVPSGADSIAVVVDVLEGMSEFDDSERCELVRLARQSDAGTAPAMLARIRWTWEDELVDLVREDGDRLIYSEAMVVEAGTSLRPNRVVQWDARSFPNGGELGTAARAIQALQFAAEAYRDCCPSATSSTDATQLRLAWVAVDDRKVVPLGSLVERHYDSAGTLAIRDRIEIAKGKVFAWIHRTLEERAAESVGVLPNDHMSLWTDAFAALASSAPDQYEPWRAALMQSCIGIVAEHANADEAAWLTSVRRLRSALESRSSGATSEARDQLLDRMRFAESLLVFRAGEPRSRAERIAADIRDKRLASALTARLNEIARAQRHVR